MSLWKKRTVSGLIAGLDIFQSLWHSSDVRLSSVDQDHFSEVLFHVSSITNLKKQDKRRFSIYFKKKRYDFMAHSEGKVKEEEGRHIQYCLLVLTHDLFIHQRFTMVGSHPYWRLEGSRVLPRRSFMDKL